MKRILCLFTCAIFLFGGCSKSSKVDITPDLRAIEGITVQRTNIDENGVYSYYEKKVSDSAEIKEFCKILDKIPFTKIEPIKISSVDYLVVFEGKKNHKLFVSGDQVIYDGQAYKFNGTDLKEKISSIYNAIKLSETPADSKLFK